MSSFFQPSNSASSLQTPNFAGTSTVEANMKQTGASTQPVPTGSGAGGAAAPAPATPTAAAPSAPGSAAPTSNSTGGQAPQAPAWTNLATFLGANQAGAHQEANQVSGSLNSAATTANAAQGTSQNIWDAAAGGTNSGSFSTTPSAPAPAAATGPTGAGGVHQNSLASKLPPVGGTPSYDFSGVNLDAYKGPTQDQATQIMAGAQAATTSAADAAKAAQTGPSEQNAWDNALLTQTPAWHQVATAIGNTQQAAENGQAAINSSQEAVNQAQNTSQARIAAQQQGLGQAQTALDASAKAGSAAATTAFNDISNAASSGSGIAPLETALSANTGALEAAGLSQAQITQMETDLTNGSRTRVDVAQALAPFLAAMSGSNGESALGAAETNSINTILNNTAAPTATANTATLGAEKSTADDAGTYLHNLGSWNGNDSATKAEIDSAIGSMIKSGMSPRDIMNAAGISGGAAYDELQLVENIEGRRGVSPADAFNAASGLRTGIIGGPAGAAAPTPDFAQYVDPTGFDTANGHSVSLTPTTSVTAGSLAADGYHHS